ncbi:MAG: class I SAM-dependent methyltransferase [Paenibacillus lautus]|jgi:SAM-dependent methyltransferase|uniref:class I SAM-dependent DNA methyltransferase n=1 Tax=Paenibacillus lautus TaxID=1401 RepID=UPI0026F2EB76|nr:class I SAM-dependent methyltransferase [Paenibacillus lautus]MCI1777534.1 class I SAM-dependent methyltransferase [Paenibacillus lautus]
MFDLSSKYYDVIYSFKDYEQEARQVREYIERQSKDYQTILDVACGTAEHAVYLKQHYAIDGIDLNPEFVAIAKSKNPKGDYSVADMTRFRLGRKYDVIMCLFSSIGYVKTPELLVQTLVQFREHLNEDGVILVEPWLTPDVWTTGRVDTITTERHGIHMSRMSHSDREGNVSIMKFSYLFGSEVGIEHYSEEHRMGLFTVEEMIGAFREAGLDVEHDTQGLIGRGMYIARIA